MFEESQNVRRVTLEVFGDRMFGHTLLRIHYLPGISQTYARNGDS